MNDQTRKQFEGACAADFIATVLAYGERCYSEGYQAGMEAAAKIAEGQRTGNHWQNDDARTRVAAAIREKANKEQA